MVDRSLTRKATVDTTQNRFFCIVHKPPRKESMVGLDIVIRVFVDVFKLRLQIENE